MKGEPVTSYGLTVIEKGPTLPLTEMTESLQDLGGARFTPAARGPGPGPGIGVHLAVEDQAGLAYNQPCNYCVFKEKFGGRGSGEVKEMVRP